MRFVHSLKCQSYFSKNYTPFYSCIEHSQIAKRLRARSGPVMANYPGRVWLPDMDRSWAEPRPRINPALACQIQTKLMQFSKNILTYEYNLNLRKKIIY